MKIKTAISTNIGSRDCNEDVCMSAQAQDGCFIVLADGLGGHGMGDLAAQLACESAVKTYELHSLTGNELLAAAFRSAQERVMLEQERIQKTEALKTTLSIVMIENGLVYSGHIGDSRIYFFHKHKLIGRTKDHSVTQILLNMGDIKEKEIRHHPDRNKLLRVIGTPWETPRYELAQPRQVYADDSFLLCSDGFWEWIIEKQMSKCLKKSVEAEEWLSSMNEIVSAASSMNNGDNFTAAVIMITEQK